MKKLLLVNGPNLNRLGVREVNVYGKGTLATLETDMKHEAEKMEGVRMFSSNMKELLSIVFMRLKIYMKE